MFRLTVRIYGTDPIKSGLLLCFLVAFCASKGSTFQIIFMETQADNYWDDASDSDGEVEREGSVIEGVIEARARAMSVEPDEGSEDDSDEYDENDEDREKVRRFLSIGCGCAKNCHKNFSFQEIYMHRLNVKEMDTDCRDMYVMGVVSKESAAFSGKTKRGGDRKRAPAKDLHFKGTQICTGAFLVCYAIGKKYLNTISSHVQNKGITPRVHGNTGKKAHNAFSYDDIKCVVEYLKNVADEKGLPQPAAPRGLDNIPPIFLPPHAIKKEMHEECAELCSSSGSRPVSLTLFKNVWSSCVPHIRIAGPREDVCAKCKKMRQQIMDARTEPEKLEATTALRDHILVAQNERDLYNDCIRRSKKEPDYTHYTFDFSQNVALPHRSRQIGPLFFLTLRKVQLFGFRIDGIPRQLNFLIDEDQTIGLDGKNTHGPNAVLSMLDWALQTYGSNRPRFSIHSDNCPGQNKNKYTMGYFMWRIMTDQSTEIEFLMQTPGHARCHVDAGFANIKKLYRRTDCETLGQLQDIVNKSSVANLAVTYPQWSWRDWKQFLDGVFKPLKCIRKSQYFRFTREEPGVVTVRTGRDAPEQKVNILKEPGFRFMSSAWPESMASGGLSQERHRYLFNSVRPYVRQTVQDEFCAPL